MTFWVYRRRDEGSDVLENSGTTFSLAGRNLIWQAWQERGQPIRRGWHVSADDLIRLQSNGHESYQTTRLLIDYDPRSSQRIVLIELLDVYLYTWDGATPTNAGWTPMMLKLRDVLEEWPDVVVTPEQKAARISRIESPTYGDPFIEFLYLNGEDKGWNWGRNGATNAVFIHAEAREYFRAYF